MGSGKSSAGKRIAALLRWKFADTDKLVEKSEGMTIPEIFSSAGEERFRNAESLALKEVSGRTRTVVACGGGTPCSAENIAVMKSTGVMVYLRLPVETLVSRLNHSGNRRPLLMEARDTELHARVQELLELRSRWYEQADLVIDSDNVPEEEMTVQIAALVRSKGAYL
ncbi:MAG: shikimate kinase [Bacteroidales bacterium]|nr:shikimate kinase [Bacteroidales bacterium]